VPFHGIDALRLIADELTNRDAAPDVASVRGLGRADFDAACDRLKALGAEVKACRDTSWSQFVQLRKEYEGLLPKLAQRLLVPMHENRLLVPMHENRLLSLATPAYTASADALASGTTHDEAF
jgi:hypothetical protein